MPLKIDGNYLGVPPPLPTHERQCGGRGPAIRRPQQCWGPPAISHAGISLYMTHCLFFLESSCFFFGWVEIKNRDFIF